MVRTVDAENKKDLFVLNLFVYLTNYYSKRFFYRYRVEWNKKSMVNIVEIAENLQTQQMDTQQSIVKNAKNIFLILRENKTIEGKTIVFAHT